MQMIETPAAMPTVSFGFTSRQKFSDLDIQALVDGQLSPEREIALRNSLATDSAARARYRELLEQKRLLTAWWRQFS